MMFFGITLDSHIRPYIKIIQTVVAIIAITTKDIIFLIVIVENKRKRPFFRGSISRIDKARANTKTDATTAEIALNSADSMVIK